MVTKYNCCAVGCTADSRKWSKLQKYPWMKGVVFHRLPDDRTLLNEWLKLINRDNFQPNRYTRICSRHFVDGAPTGAHPLPTLFAYNNPTMFTGSEHRTTCKTLCGAHTSPVTVLDSVSVSEIGDTSRVPRGKQSLKRDGTNTRTDLEVKRAKTGMDRMPLCTTILIDLHGEVERWNKLRQDHNHSQFVRILLDCYEKSLQEKGDQTKEVSSVTLLTRNGHSEGSVDIQRIFTEPHNSENYAAINMNIKQELENYCLQDMSTEQESDCERSSLTGVNYVSQKQNESNIHYVNIKQELDNDCNSLTGVSTVSQELNEHNIHVNIKEEPGEECSSLTDCNTVSQEPDTCNINMNGEQDSSYEPNSPTGVNTVSQDPNKCKDSGYVCNSLSVDNSDTQGAKDCDSTVKTDVAVFDFNEGVADQYPEEPTRYDGLDGRDFISTSDPTPCQDLPAQNDSMTHDKRWYTCGVCEAMFCHPTDYSNHFKRHIEKNSCYT